MSAAIRKAYSVNELRRAAKRSLPGFLFDFIEGGVDDEIGLKINDNSFDNYKLLPRFLSDISHRNITTELFGYTFSFPYGIAPTGTAALFRPNADTLLCQAAVSAGIPIILSGASCSSIEDISKLGGTSVWSQLYIARERTITYDQIKRARDAGSPVLVVTVDVPVSPKRERHLRNNITVPFRLTLSHIPRMVRELFLHPGWFARYLLSGGMPALGNWSPYCAAGSRSGEIAEFYMSQAFDWMDQPSQTWSDIETLRRLWPGRLVIKGLLHPDDATRAVDCGADGIIVSNHGAKALDRAPAAIDMLPAIAASVGARTTVMFDSGIRRGSDIVTAICLGARFTFGGRATLYGVAAGGLAGAQKAIQLLEQETSSIMAGIGCADVHNLGPQYVLGHGTPPLND